LHTAATACNQVSYIYSNSAAPAGQQNNFESPPPTLVPPKSNYLETAPNPTPTVPTGPVTTPQITQEIRNPSGRNSTTLIQSFPTGPPVAVESITASPSQFQAYIPSNEHIGLDVFQPIFTGNGNGVAGAVTGTVAGPGRSSAFLPVLSHPAVAIQKPVTGVTGPSVTAICQTAPKDPKSMNDPIPKKILTDLQPVSIPPAHNDICLQPINQVPALTTISAKRKISEKKLSRHRQMPKLTSRPEPVVPASQIELDHWTRFCQVR